VADKAISDKLPGDIWSGVVDLVLAGIKSNDLATGLSRGITKCGELLIDKFPISENDMNELPNHLVI